MADLHPRPDDRGSPGRCGIAPSWNWNPRRFDRGVSAGSRPRTTRSPWPQRTSPIKSADGATHAKGSMVGANWPRAWTGMATKLIRFGAIVDGRLRFDRELRYGRADSYGGSEWRSMPRDDAPNVCQ